MYPPDAPRAYDDTGWTLGLHMDVKCVEIKDKAIFDAPVASLTGPVEVKGKVEGGKASCSIHHQQHHDKQHASCPD